tara:strand:+ start:113 stop:292 length:180 start_codon:yes stop_codon:yes gene_type:complete
VITLVVVVIAGKKMQSIMNKRLKLTIDKFNKIPYKKNNSKRIIIGTLKPNCDNSLKRSK